MTRVTVELRPDIYDRLQAEAERQGQPVAALVEAWVVEHLQAPVAPDERERIRAVMAASGLLTNLSPDLQHLAAQSTATLEDVQAAFARAGGPPLSETVLEQRGPKP